MNILQIAQDVVLEAKRNSFFWLSVIFACLLVFLFAIFTGTNSEFDYDRFLHGGLATVWVIHMLLAILLTAETLYGEDERQSVYFYLVRNVSRIKYLMGKFLGCWLTLLISLFLSGITMLIAVNAIQGFELKIIGALIFIGLQIGVSIGLIIVLSRLLPKILSLVVFGFLFIFSNFVEFFILKSSAPIAFGLLSLPSFKYFGYLEMMVNYHTFSSWIYLAILVIFTLSICGVLICLASLAFERQTL